MLPAAGHWHNEQRYRGNREEEKWHEKHEQALMPSREENKKKKKKVTFDTNVWNT